jgi:hypothetical protein
LEHRAGLRFTLRTRGNITKRVKGLELTPGTGSIRTIRPFAGRGRVSSELKDAYSQAR